MAHVHRHLTSMAVAFVALLSFAGTTMGQVPQTLQFQGYLTDANGKPIDGPMSIRFRLYKAATTTTPFWEETLSVAMTRGHFTVRLGLSKPLSSALFIANPKPFIGVKAGTDPEMTPRLAVTSVPFAHVAQNVTKEAKPDVAELKVGGKTVINAKGEWTGPATGYSKSESDARYVQKSSAPKLTCRPVSKSNRFGAVIASCATDEHALSGSCSDGKNPQFNLSKGRLAGIQCANTNTRVTVTAQAICCKLSH